MEEGVRRRPGLAGVRCGAATCSGVWEWGVSEKASGEAFWGTCSAAAREKSRAGALQRARHRDGEVAAAGLGGGTWQSKERHSAMAKGGGELLCDAWKPARARGGAGRRPRAAGGVATRRRQSQQRSLPEGEENGLLCYF